MKQNNKFSKRNNNRNNSFGNWNSAPRQMHKATCAKCKKECEVPFKPSEDRPVYCKECYQNEKRS